MAIIQERAAALLAKNAEQSEVYATADNFLFFNKKQAEAHASRLQDKNITTITREVANNPETVIPEGNGKPATEEQIVEDAKKAAETDTDAELEKVNTAGVEQETKSSNKKNKK